jgi:hypothetical protein
VTKRAGVITSVVKKSQAVTTFWCLLMKVAHVVFLLLSRTGGIPFGLKHFQEIDR